MGTLISSTLMLGWNNAMFHLRLTKMSQCIVATAIWYSDSGIVREIY